MKRARPRWQCSYCSVNSTTRKRIETHEAQCFKNSKRQPFAGELTHVFSTGKMTHFDLDNPDNYPAGMDWFEWVEHEEMPPWWPGDGMMWTGEDWVDVPGHRIDYPTGAHGCAGGPEPFDVWPKWHGEPLDQIETTARLELCRAGWPFDQTCSTEWWESVAILVAPGIAPERPHVPDGPF